MKGKHVTMMDLTNMTMHQVLVIEQDDEQVQIDPLTPAQERALGERMNQAIDHLVEKTLYGGYAPAIIDPGTVVSDQTPGQKRVSSEAGTEVKQS